MTPRRRTLLLLLLALALSACGGATPVSEPAAPLTKATPMPDATTMSGKFSPPAGQAQLIIGQDTGSIDAYAESTHVIPGGVTNYTSVSKLEGIHQTADYGYQNKQ